VILDLDFQLMKPGRRYLAVAKGVPEDAHQFEVTLLFCVTPALLMPNKQCMGRHDWAVGSV
jgi:hypothetical protein